MAIKFFTRGVQGTVGAQGLQGLIGPIGASNAHNSVEVATTEPLSHSPVYAA